MTTLTDNFDIEWQKMLNGEPYNAGHAGFIKLLSQTRELIFDYNNLRPSCVDKQQELLDKILGKHGERIQINQPFRCDYGCNISIGENFFANFNLTILDEALVTIGDNVFIGPNVSIFTACHSTVPEERNMTADNQYTEWAEPVTIGNDVWIGGDVTILPGVAISDGSTIGAGSVVTHNIPARCVAVGNPCLVIRHIDKDN